MTLLNTEEELNLFFQDNAFAAITYYLETDCEGCEALLPVFEEIAEEPAQRVAANGRAVG